MGKKEPAGYSIDVQDTLLQMAGEDPQLAAKLVQLAEAHEARVAAMTPEEREALRLKEDAILAEEREGLRALKHEQEALEKESERIDQLRADGLVGTQTEVGRPYGLNARAVGKILDIHDLRRRIPTQTGRGELQLLRGVGLGFAVHDPYTGREYWVADKVKELLAVHRRK